MQIGTTGFVKDKWGKRWLCCWTDLILNATFDTSGVTCSIFGGSSFCSSVKQEWWCYLFHGDKNKLTKCLVNRIGSTSKYRHQHHDNLSVIILSKYTAVSVHSVRVSWNVTAASWVMQDSSVSPLLQMRKLESKQVRWLAWLHTHHKGKRCLCNLPSVMQPVFLCVLVYSPYA